MFDLYTKKLINLYEKITNIWIFHTTKYRKLTESENSKISEKFNDSIAQQISWLPLINLTNFLSCKYNIKGNDRWWRFVLVLDIIYIIIYLLLIFIWLMWIKSIIFDIINWNISFNLNYLLAILIGFIWIIKYLSDSRPLVFDKKLWFFYKWKYENNLLNKYENSLNNSWLNKSTSNILLSDIYAIQLICKKDILDKNSYTECNLVLNNLKRVNIFSQFHLWESIQNAQNLWLYLWVPVWDNTDIVIWVETQSN